MRRIVLYPCVGLLGALALALPTAAEARAPRYAVVNAGPADFDTARQLLRIYGQLSPKKKSPAPSARKPPVAPRRAGVGKSPRARTAFPVQLSPPIQGRALRRALAGLPHDEAAAMAASGLVRGKKLYATLKRAKAAEALAQAVALYDAHLPLQAARSALVEANTYLLLCHHALGQTTAAQKIAARLRELTGNKAPKGVPAALWSAYPLTPLVLTPRRVVTVKVAAKARVYLDDQLAGKGPLQLHVGPGAHRIRVELSGHRVFTREVAAGASAQTVVVSLVPQATDAFGDIRKALAKMRRATTRWDKKPLRALSKRLFIDHLLVCVLEGGSLKARWYSTRLKKWASAELSVPPPGAAGLPKPLLAAYSKVATAERKQAKALADIDGQQKKKKKSSTKLWKKWYFWVAAALVAGVVAAFAIKDSVTEEKVILRVTRP